MTRKPGRRPAGEEVDLALFLAPLVGKWGRPDARWVCARSPKEVALDVFSFPGGHARGVHRFVTFGVAYRCRAARNEPCELLFALTHDLGGATQDEVSACLAGVVAHAEREDLVLEVGTLIGSGRRTPRTWGAKTVLIEEASGEPGDIQTLPTRQGPVHLRWLMPVHSREAALIRGKGIAAWDDVWRPRREATTDPRRPCFVEGRRRIRGS
jgi:hypothetical protein